MHNPRARLRKHILAVKSIVIFKLPAAFALEPLDDDAPVCFAVEAAAVSEAW